MAGRRLEGHLKVQGAQLVAMNGRFATMGIRARFEALELTHSSLEEKIESEMARPRPDDALLRRLKRRKLVIKDELEAIRLLMAAIGAEERSEGRVRRNSRTAREHALAATRTAPAAALAS